VVSVSNETELADLARRIVIGDVDAEAELFHRYKESVSMIINRIVQSRSATEDIFQETFTKVIVKIRSGNLREPERLSGFISAIAKNLALEHVRKARRSAKEIEVETPDQIADTAPDPLEQLWRKERDEIIRQVFSELKIKRDREVLLRYYIGEEGKDQICADLGLTRDQLNMVIFRAVKRYKELYKKLAGKYR
jgi:RNA polymerase sigma-70 factor, ECF subfamily